MKTVDTINGSGYSKATEQNNEGQTMNAVYKKSTRVRKRRILRNCILGILSTIAVISLMIAAMIGLLFMAIDAHIDYTNANECNALKNAPVLDGNQLSARYDCQQYYDTGSVKYMRK